MAVQKSKKSRGYYRGKRVIAAKATPEVPEA